MERRGRPTVQTEIITKYEQTFYEVPTKPELGWVMKWFYDIDKAPLSGPYKTECTYPKDYKFEKPDIQKNQTYGKLPVVLVFKTSKRANAKTKMKIWKNTNIDYICTSNKLPGVPKGAVILELSVGDSFIKKYQLKYNL